ncbi:hypothetical protein JHN61_04525 [Streptomyces sp. MBT67]|uniref:hypothetical protein n=1 Tax=unclassified Streptomyces TaxID=2593676 RepID=UPI00190D2350|nr:MULTISPECIES: hypothetical protein [unclassified Streptomyces]MBK3531067.1 hypothetical protein [Streptomyces sp. MBT72]MBK3535498.1 hypothetical protein [Streptomyces sp. MBT67]MBK3552931.1 hypothetical protein [Streptomyces sp. MBT61]MBK6032159.1 hypothetical protein [Streptomyces sp. MBT59]
MHTHPDLPDTLVHFTGRPRGRGERRDFPPSTPEQRLVSILHSGTLRGAQTFGTDAPVICFSEVTEEARRTMLRDGTGRGPYKPWGLVLHRQQLIDAGARPVLYLSGRELSQTHQLPTRLRNRRVRYDPGQSDWLHEREWRVCFETGEVPVLPIAPQLIAGVIVDTSGWTPPPRAVSPQEKGTKLGLAFQAVQHAMKENSDHPWSSTSVEASDVDFAWPAHGLARWHWNGAELVPDGRFDIPAQVGEVTMSYGGTLPGTIRLAVDPDAVRDQLRGEGRV